jgi:hypothetical protein
MYHIATAFVNIDLGLLAVFLMAGILAFATYIARGK